MRLWMVFGLVACSSTEGPTAGEILEGPEDFPEAPPQKKADEVFALYERVVEATDNPNPFSSGTADSETHALKRMVYTPGDVTYREQLCATWGNEVFGTRWTFAADFPERRGIVERPLVQLDEAGFEAGPYADLLGTDIETGPLPEEPDDPGVVDTDEDGEPGVTVFIDNDILGAGEVYIAQRSTTRLVGDWVDADMATGPFETNTESNTLDASTVWLRIQGPGNEPQPEKSFFVLMRIDPTLDCMAIDEQADGWGLTERP
ncbi:MAG: hypothetical protein AAGA48_34320 [Myxococcota bacterium]